MKRLRLYDSEDHLTEAALDDGVRLVPAGTVLIVVRGMILAKECPVSVSMRPMAFNQDLKAIDCRPGVEPQFILYWLLANSHQVLGIADEAAHGTKRLQSDRLLGLAIRLPPPELQRRIASILSAYDDLIENNTRRIAILEEMARLLYREWFVHFRFPGHQKVRIVESPMGGNPEGWEQVSFSRAAEFVNGYAFKPSDWGTEGDPIIKIRELKDGVTSQTPRYSGTLAEKYRIRNGDVLFSWSADLDAYVWASGNAWLNQHLFLVRPRKGVSEPFIFYALKERMPEFRARSLGTTMRHIKRSALDQVILLLPPPLLRRRFTDSVAPILDQVLCLGTKNANLRATRDLLLPKLVSGEIDVSDVKSALREAARR